MGKKRHFKGNSRSEDSKRRRDNAEQWRSERGDDRDNQRSRSWYESKENARLEAYYKCQGFVQPGEDWENFVSALKRELPACFRINSDYKFADDLRAQLLEYAGSKMEVNGIEVEAVQPIPWYPNGYGYKLGTDRKTIRKYPELNKLHKWMMQHTENGNITRQEAVSMVPPLALAVEPHHKCLDMCAAPGSKTSQLLEIVNRSLTGDNQDNYGLVVANDADTDRAYMLVHQCRRINSPLLVITTHKGQLFPSMRSMGAEHRGEFFDRVLCDVPCSGDGTMRKNPMIWGKWCTAQAQSLHALQIMIAERGVQLTKPGGLMVYSTCSMSPLEDEAVVAELLRLHPELELVDARECIARSHGLAEGVAPPAFRARAGLHSWYVLDDYKMVTKEINSRKKIKRDEHFERRRANNANGDDNVDATDDAVPADAPIADAAPGEETVATEAVAEEAVAEDAVVEEEVDDGRTRAERLHPTVTDPLLIECINMGMDYYPTPADAAEHNSRFKPSMFPPSAEEAARMGLEKCLRCVPHDEDTGGFFVATFRKKELPSNSNTQKTEITEATATTASDAAETVVAAPAPVAPKAHPFQLVEYKHWDQDAFNLIRDFYGLDDRVISAKNFYVRFDHAQTKQQQRQQQQHKKPAGNAETENRLLNKTVYFLPNPVGHVLEAPGLKVVAAGIKVLEKRHTSGAVAAVNAAAIADGTNAIVGGVHVLHEYRLLQEGLDTLGPHITKRRVSITLQDLCNMLAGGLVSYTTLDPATVVQLLSHPVGCLICVYEHDNGTKKSTFHLVIWRGTSRTVNVMCHKTDLDLMTHQLEILGILL